MGDLIGIGLFVILICCLFQCCLFGEICCPRRVAQPDTGPAPTSDTAPTCPTCSPAPTSGTAPTRPTAPTFGFTSYSYYYCNSSCQCVRGTSSSYRSNECNPNNSLSCCTSSNCCRYSYCCRSNYCLPTLTFEVNPNRLFVNQDYTLSWRVNSPSACGAVSCVGSCTYLGHNCQDGQVLPQKLGICPPSNINLSSLCDPNSQFHNKTLNSSSSIIIKANQDYWGKYQYSLTCQRADGISLSQNTQEVFVLPVLYYQETPFSSIIQPFLSLINR